MPLVFCLLLQQLLIFGDCYSVNFTAFVAVFNVGEYRRMMTGAETVMADFFHPTNNEARRIREYVDLMYLLHLIVLLCISI